MSRIPPALKTPTAGLIALAALPVLLGLAQLGMMIAGIIRGAALDPELAHYVAHPVAIGLHLVTGVGMLVAGLFQVNPRLRLRKKALHRLTGRCFVAAGIICGATAIWMNEFHPAFGGWSKYSSNLFFGIAMPLALVLGLRAAIQRRIAEHRAWMIRAYAIALGAGTQRILILPIFAVYGLPGDPWLGLLLWLSWLINVAFAEWWLRRKLGATAPQAVMA